MNWKIRNYEHECSVPCAGSLRACLKTLSSTIQSTSVTLRRQHACRASQLYVGHDRENSDSFCQPYGRNCVQSTPQRAICLRQQSGNQQGAGGRRACSTCRSSRLYYHHGNFDVKVCETATWRHRSRLGRSCYGVLRWQPLDRRKCAEVTCLSDAASSAAGTSGQHEHQEGSQAGLSPKWDPAQVSKPCILSGACFIALICTRSR